MVGSSSSPDWASCGFDPFFDSCGIPSGLSLLVMAQLANVLLANWQFDIVQLKSLQWTNLESKTTLLIIEQWAILLSLMVALISVVFERAPSIMVWTLDGADLMVIFEASHANYDKAE